MDPAKIMIIEDESLVGLDIRNTLQDLGYYVTAVFAEAELALKQLETESVDLILMDIHLPQKDGFTATREIKSFARNVVVIAQTAYALSQNYREAREAGCDDFLTKPLSPGYLLGRMNDFLS